MFNNSPSSCVATQVSRTIEINDSFRNLAIFLLALVKMRNCTDVCFTILVFAHLILTNGAIMVDCIYVICSPGLITHHNSIYSLHIGCKHVPRGCVWSNEKFIPP